MALGLGIAFEKDIFILTKQGKEDAMEKYKISSAIRFFLLGASAIIWVGIWLTGFGIVQWLLYLPAVMLAFAALTGICPGMIISKMLFGVKK